MTDEKFVELVGEALGRASMAWSETPTGIFDSDTCSALHVDILNAHDELIKRERVKSNEQITSVISKEEDEEWKNPLDASSLYTKLEHERAKSQRLVEVLESILKIRSCTSHKIGDCPSSDEKNIYIPAHQALAEYKKEG